MNKERTYDYGVLAFLCILASVVGFFYLGGAHSFFDRAVSHADIHLYIPPFLQWTDSAYYGEEFQMRYALYQMPKGYMYVMLCLIRVLPLIMVIKVLPILLSCLSLVVLYKLVRLSVPVAAALLTCVIFCVHSWTFHVYQALCPRAFFYPLLLIFLYALGQKKWGWCALVYCLSWFFYPQVGVLVLGTALLVWGWHMVQYRWSVIHNLQWMGVLVGAIAIAGILYYVQYPVSLTHEFGPTISRSVMMHAPEFGPLGKEPFWFALKEWPHWLMSKRAGCGLNEPLLVLLGIMVVWGVFGVYIKRKVTIPFFVIPLGVASVGMFALAYAALFYLYFPARYVMFTLPLLMSVMVGCMGAAFLEQCVHRYMRRILTVLFVGMIIGSYGTYLSLSRMDPHRGGAVNYHYIDGLVQYLSTVPQGSMVAAPPYIADALPLFSHKKVLFSDRSIIPFQEGYYAKMKQRVFDFYTAYYADDIQTMKAFCEAYQVDYVVFNKRDFSLPQSMEIATYLEPFASYERERSAERDAGVLVQALSSYIVYEDEQFLIVDGALL